MRRVAGQGRPENYGVRRQKGTLMPEAGASQRRDSARSSPARVRANVGLVAGFVVGLLLALTEVTVAVRMEAERDKPFRFRVVVLGGVIFRYPEDGDLYQMRPVPQALAARNELVFASAVVGSVLGWSIGYASGRWSCVTGRSASTGPPAAT